MKALKQTGKWNRIEYLLLFTALFFFIQHIVMTNNLFASQINSDLAGALLNGEMAFREKTLMPMGFNYSSVGGFQSHTLTAFLCFPFTQDFHIAFVVGGAIFMAAFLACSWLLAHSFGFSRWQCLVFISVMLFPYSEFTMTMHNYAQFYLIQLTGIFVAMAIFNLSAGANTKKAVVFCIITFIHGFLQALNGTRYISFFLLPFVVFFAYYLWTLFRDHGFAFLKIKEAQIKCAVGISTILGTGTGFLFFLIYIKTHYSTYSFSATTISNSGIYDIEVFDSFFAYIRTYAEAWGAKFHGQSLGSLEGLSAVAALLISILLVVILIQYLHKEDSAFKYKEYAVFIAASAGINTFLCIIVSWIFPTHRYHYLYMYLLPMLLLFYLFSHHCILKFLRKSFFNFFLAGILVVMLVISEASAVKRIADSDPNISPVYSDTIRWLEQNEYSFGYASYWNSNLLTVLSNRNIEFAALAPATEEIGVILPWFGGMPRDYYMDSYKPGKAVVLLTYAEFASVEDSLPEGYTLSYSNDRFVFLTYDHKPFHFECDLIANFPIVNVPYTLLPTDMPAVGEYQSNQETQIASGPWFNFPVSGTYRLEYNLHLDIAGSTEPIGRAEVWFDGKMQSSQSISTANGSSGEVTVIIENVDISKNNKNVEFPFFINSGNKAEFLNLKITRIH